MAYYVGIDVGGTKIYAVMIDGEGKIVSRAKIKIGNDTSFDVVFPKILDCYRNVGSQVEIDEDQIAAVGVSVPSSVDRVYRVIKHAPNLGWINLKFFDVFQQGFGKPFFVGNDVNMGTFGEYHFGAGKGKGYKSLYGIFIGTGIGGGYIVQGEIIRGMTYTAGEIGHTILKMNGPRCSCGGRGCFEAFAGKSGMITYMKRLVDKRREKTLLDKLAPHWRITVGSSALRKAFQKKDRVVVKAVKRSAHATGVAIGNIISTTGVDAIILGGGIIEEMGDVLMPLIKKSMLKYTFGDGADGVALLESLLGDDAVALGAAWFVRLPEKQDMLFR